MKNVETTVEGNKLVITVDLSQNYGPSNSGKTEIIASSEGNKPIPDHPEIRFGLNVHSTEAGKDHQEIRGDLQHALAEGEHGNHP